MGSEFVLGWVDPQILSLSPPSSLPAGVHGSGCKGHSEVAAGTALQFLGGRGLLGDPGAKPGRSTGHQLLASRVLADSFLSRLRPLTQAPGFRRGRARHGPRPRLHVPLLPDIGPRHGLGPMPVSPGGAGSAAEAQKHGREPPPAAACPPQTQSCYDRHATHRCNVQAPGLNPDGR